MNREGHGPVASVRLVAMTGKTSQYTEFTVEQGKQCLPNSIKNWKHEQATESVQTLKTK